MGTNRRNIVIPTVCEGKKWNFPYGKITVFLFHFFRTEKFQFYFHTKRNSTKALRGVGNSGILWNFMEIYSGGNIGIGLYIK
jgi:hypothetical protein